MKIAFYNYFKFNKNFYISTQNFFNSQFITRCLTKDDIIFILDFCFPDAIKNDSFMKIIFYEPHQFMIYETKISRLEKEIKRLKNKLNNLSEVLTQVNYEKNQLSYIDDEIIRDVFANYKKAPKSRKYDDKFIVFCLISCLFGRKCYNFMRRRLPLVSVSYLKQLSSPTIKSIIKSLFNINQISYFIELYKSINFHVTLSVDAASFQKIAGEDLLKKFPILNEVPGLNICKETIYSNIFVFLLQPFSNMERTIPIHIYINENGNGNIAIIKCIKEIVSQLKLFNIGIDFISTDGDHFYDLEHNLFFDEYVTRVYDFHSFGNIYNL